MKGTARDLAPAKFYKFPSLGKCQLTSFAWEQFSFGHLDFATVVYDVLASDAAFVFVFLTCLTRKIQSNLIVWGPAVWKLSFETFLLERWEWNLVWDISVGILRFEPSSSNVRLRVVRLKDLIL